MTDRWILHSALLIAIGLASGCPRPIPDHLKLPDTKDGSNEGAAVFESADDVVVQLVGRDPLVRAPSLPDVETLAELDGAEPLVEFIQRVRTIEQGKGEPGPLLDQLEQLQPGTVAIPLSRGYRLRMVENRLPKLRAADNEVVQREVVSLLTPLHPQGPEADQLPLAPLHWLGTDGASLRGYGDRWVLTGWLEAPGMPLQPVREALDVSQYDALRESQIGQLLVSRVDGASGDPAAGYEALAEATHLALTQAAADRDREQADWSDLKKERATALGVDDPEAARLQEAITALTAAAAADDAAGGALLAVAASRWHDTCVDAPCGGLDRVAAMRAASRWGDKVRTWAEIWQVIALKEAIDTMDVAHETVLFPQAMIKLLDAMIGTGTGGLDADLLLFKRPDASVWLELARAAGTEGATDWESAQVALGRLLAAEAGEALAHSPSDEDRALLERIEARAIP